MRYALTLLLGILFLILAGLATGYLFLDFSAPEDRQLTAAGTLAYYDCYYNYDFDQEECEWVHEGPSILDEEPDEFFPEDPFYMGEPEIFVDQYGGLVDPWGEPVFFEGPEIWEEGARYYEWEVWEDGYDVVPITVVEDPWYVGAFPGIGRMVQQIIPGSQSAPRVVVQPAYAPPSPPPPQRIVYPQPSCWVSAQPTTVAYGGSSLLEWSSFNASRVSFSDIGTVPAQGSRMVSPITGDRTFTLSVLGQGGSGSCYTRVSVDSGNSAMPSCAISAHPSTISQGQSASLAWVSSNAQSATLSGYGAVSVTGGTFITPQTSTLYTLTIRDSLGRQGTCTAQVGVLP